MLNRFALGLLLTAGLMVPAHGQKATEIFIPIGQSPGVSMKTSVIGTIQSFDAATRIIIVQSPDGEHRATITETTKIWLDNSRLGKTNVAASQSDCTPGRRCEIKYVYDGGARTEMAEWIKLGAADSGED